MTNPSQTETSNGEGSGRNQQQGASSPDASSPERKPGKDTQAPANTEQGKGAANGGTHPVHVKNR